MAIVYKCSGCGAFIKQENLAYVRTPKQKRVIDYVHKSRFGVTPNVIPSCHRQAYLNLKEDFPEMEIDGRMFNEKTIPETLMRRKSGPSTDSTRFASQQRGMPRITCHTGA